MISVAPKCVCAATVPFAGTREQFARALWSLAAGIEAEGPAVSGWHVRRVMLGCSYETWTHTVGQVPATVDYPGPGGSQGFQVWEYRCVDGSVYCVAARRRHETGVQSIAVRAICFPDHDDEAAAPARFQAVPSLAS